MRGLFMRNELHGWMYWGYGLAHLMFAVTASLLAAILAASSRLAPLRSRRRDCRRVHVEPSLLLLREAEAPLVSQEGV